MTKQEGVHPEPVCDAAPASGLRGGEAEPAAGWEIQYAVGHFVHVAPFNTERSATNAYRRFKKARADYRQFSNDGTAVFEMKSAIGTTSVVLEHVANISLVNVAASVKRAKQISAALSSPTQVMDRDTGGGG